MRLWVIAAAAAACLGACQQQAPGPAEVTAQSAAARAADAEVAQANAAQAADAAPDANKVEDSAPPPPAVMPPEPPSDRTWYVIAPREGSCFPMDVALGVSSPDEFIKEAAKRGGNYHYVRNTDDAAMVTEPLRGSPIAFVRGKTECLLALKMIQDR